MDRIITVWPGPALAAGLLAVFAAFLYALFEAWRDARRRQAGEAVRSTS